MSIVSRRFAPHLPLFLLRHRRKPQSTVVRKERRPRVNEEINSSEVLLVGDGKDPEKISLQDALIRAREKEMDLIEVGSNADPPVVKIGVFGHYLYQLQKKDKRQRARSKQSEVKMLRFGFRTERHDLDRLLERAREFFGEHHSVKFVVRLRGRELTNTEYAKSKLQAVVDALADSGEVDQEMKRQGNQFIVVLRAKH